MDSASEDDYHDDSSISSISDGGGDDGDGGDGGEADKAHLIPAIEHALDYVGDQLGNERAPYIRHAAIARLASMASEPVLTLPQLLSEVQRYVGQYDKQLPYDCPRRANMIEMAVARVLQLPIGDSMLRATCLAAASRMPSIPPASELADVEMQLFDGKAPKWKKHWLRAAPTASREELRHQLCEASAQQLARMFNSLGLHVPPVPTPVLQHVYEYDVRAGHPDALPVLNADIASIYDGRGPVENIRLRLHAVKSSEHRARRTTGSDATRKLCSLGSAALRTGRGGGPAGPV